MYTAESIIADGSLELPPQSLRVPRRCQPVIPTVF